jgi:3-hydroxyacyl-CoA dehydrogenase
MAPRGLTRVGVIGAGVMGSGIASHFANAGIEVLMLDIVPPNLTEAEKKRRAKRNSFGRGRPRQGAQGAPGLVLPQGTRGW